MRSRFGEAFSNLPRGKKSAGSKFMNQFESAKREFGDSQCSKTYRFNLKMAVRGSSYYDDDDDEHLFST
jgi:hypothetical protein